MSPSGVDGVTIPARITVRDLAAAIGREPREVAAVLVSRSQPAGADDYVSAENYECGRFDDAVKEPRPTNLRRGS